MLPPTPITEYVKLPSLNRNSVDESFNLIHRSRVVHLESQSCKLLPFNKSAILVKYDCRKHFRIQYNT